MTRYWAAAARLPTGFATGVALTVAGDRFAAVEPGVPCPPDAVRLPGVVVPGLANAHSHAFHRALRGRVQGRGTFWSWREAMFSVASLLSPGTYLELATAVYAEMALAGVTTVGEFHYVHHQFDGRPYDNPAEMSVVLEEAASRAGIRITVLDTVYLQSTVDGLPLEGIQRRFGGPPRDYLPSSPHARAGTALHSIRAVPATLLPEFAGRSPLHLHLSEQRAENEACMVHYGLTPTRVFQNAGVLGPGTTAVHATHLNQDDVTALGSTGTTVCFCPTTERDLADGIGPAAALRDAGSPLSLGSDGHAVVDLFEEARAVELNERLRSERRGQFEPGELLGFATAHASLGWPDAGAIAPGALADLVAVRTDTVRMAGVPLSSVVFGASAGDVDTVLVSGRVVVSGGAHQLVPDVPRALEAAIARFWP